MDASTNPTGPMAAVRENIDVDYIEFRKAAKSWSFVYHVFQFGSAVLTVASARRAHRCAPQGQRDYM
jgi:hypothetical protein